MGLRIEGLLYVKDDNFGDRPNNRSRQTFHLGEGSLQIFKAADQPTTPSWVLPLYMLEDNPTGTATAINDVWVKPPVAVRVSQSEMQSFFTGDRISRWNVWDIQVFDKYWHPTVHMSIAKDWTHSADATIELPPPADAFPTAADVGALPTGATSYYANIRDRQIEGTTVRDTWDVRLVYSGWATDVLKATTQRSRFQSRSAEGVVAHLITSSVPTFTALTSAGNATTLGATNLGVPSPWEALILSGRDYIRQHPTVFQRFYIPKAGGGHEIPHDVDVGLTSGKLQRLVAVRRRPLCESAAKRA